MSRRNLALSVGLFAFGLICMVQAQVTTATFYGIVMDPTSAVIGNARVMLLNEGTQATSTTTTDDSGEFAFTFVPVGTYTLRIETAGFKTSEARGIELQAAQNIRRTFVLDVGEVAEKVEVKAGAVTVNTVSAEQNESVSQQRVIELPIARRNVASVIGLGTGVVRSGGDVILNGLGRGATSITLDGTDASSNPERPSTAMFGDFNFINTVSMEAVQEVQTSKGVIPAEYSRAVSGNVNVITRSGTNQWHGSLFENFQSEELNARNQFLASKPGFTFNQFGGSAGGRVIKNRAFIFGVYEGYREAAFSPVSANVPSERLRNAMIEAVPDYKLFLDTLPLPNQPYNPAAATGFYQGAGSRRSSDNHFVVKPDVRLADNISLSLTYTRDRPTNTIPRVSPVNFRNFAGETDRYTVNFTYFRPRWSSETRYGYNYNKVNRLDGLYNVKDPRKQEASPGGRRVAGISALGFSNDGEINVLGAPNQSWEQKFALTLNQHSLRFGGIYFRRGIGRFNIETPNVRYESEADLLANIPSRVQNTFGVDEYEGRSKEFGFFFQDDWRITPRLVVNLGLRYDYFSNLTAHGINGGPPNVFNPAGILDSRFTLGPFRPSDNPWDSDAINFGPRLGFSYNPDGRAKNVIRGGFSTLFTPISGELYTQTILNGPTTPFRSIFSKSDAQTLGLRYPIYNEDVLPLVKGGVAARSFRVLNPQISAPYSFNLYLGYQRELTASLMLESAFVGTRGVKFQMARNYNQVDRITGLRPNQQIGTGDYWDNSDSTHYVSWQSSLRKRFSHGLLFNAHYTWGKAIAYGRGDTAFGGSNVQDFFNVQANRGPAENDVTHNFVADFVYDLPRFSNSNALTRHTIGGWQFSGILSARTGLPLIITEPSAISDSRPDYAGGPPTLDDNRVTLQYLNKAAYVPVVKNPVSGATIRPGNLGNGAVRGRGSVNMDFGLGKNFRITEGARFQFRADMFNALNHTNFTSISTNIEAANFGRFTNTAGARQVQINARFQF